MLNRDHKSVSMAMGALADPTAQPKTSFLDDFASRTLVIIPAHNEEECVAGVVRGLRERGFLRIRVVDNASTDRTAELAAAAGARVVSAELSDISGAGRLFSAPLLLVRTRSS